MTNNNSDEKLLFDKLTPDFKEWLSSEELRTKLTIIEFNVKGNNHD
jgi:hypothetical protein